MDAIVSLLTSARHQGFLGPGGVVAHVDHGLAFAALIPQSPDRAIDLGSGAGIPGLILASFWADSNWVLVDVNARRTAFLGEAIATLGLADRVNVVARRAELAGRDPSLRASADLVVSRGFGAPALTAECGAPFLRPGGFMVVAEPPGGAPNRWPADGLGILGLVADVAVSAPVALQRLQLASLCPDRYPRRVGIPAKRPLF